MRDFDGVGVGVEYLPTNKHLQSTADSRRITGEIMQTRVQVLPSRCQYRQSQTGMSPTNQKKFL